MKTAKKSTAKKIAKAPVKKAPAKASSTSSKKLPATTKSYNKTQILAVVSQLANVSKKQASDMVEALTKIIEAHLKKGTSFTLPGIMKCYILQKPAVKAHKGINPFTKEEIMFKAKPARNVVRIRPLKKLKDFV